MKQLLIAASLVAAGLSYGAAHAQTPLSFSQVDSDNSGSISMDELKIAAPDMSEEQFNSADADGNGMLDQQEFAVLSPSASRSPVAPESHTGGTSSGDNLDSSGTSNNPGNGEGGGTSSGGGM
jgi:hypothetical protein